MTVLRNKRIFTTIMRIPIMEINNLYVNKSRCLLTCGMAHDFRNFHRIDYGLLKGLLLSCDSLHCPKHYKSDVLTSVG